MVRFEFVVGGSGGKEKAKVCLFQAGPEAQPNKRKDKSMSVRRLIFWAASPFAIVDEAAC